MVRETIRSGILRLRELTEAAFDDEFHGVLYWSDEQLQTILDRFSTYVPRFPLRSFRVLENGVWQTRVKSFSVDHFLAIEEMAAVYDENGFAYTGEHTIDYTRRLVFFGDSFTDTEAMYSIELTWYDLTRAAADVWRMKAGQRADYIQMQAGTHKSMFQQEYEHCLERQRYFESLTWTGVPVREQRSSRRFVR